ncbi:MAG TPA: hypothetical protein VFX15_03885 [Actinomycetes bacterium]|nr:hypothetical protein [Actinomycetes bacterium]
MNLKRKTPALVAAGALVVGGSLLAATAPATAGSSGASERVAQGKNNDPLVVRLKSNDNKTVVSRDHFRPGVTEFKVTKTAKKNSSIVIVQSENLERSFKLLNKAFGGGTGSADAMKKFDKITTLYSGAGRDGRWQVKLHKGKYYALDSNTNNVTSFRVKGERRSAHMKRGDSEITTTKDNMFRTSGPIQGPWVRFTNNSREVHFAEADHVKESTTNKDVRKALQSNKQPKWILRGGFFLEIESPGISTVHKVDVPGDKVLLICFMPSEEQDGVPHAFMGMWKLNQSRKS